jgi:hypothetical protein
MQFSDETLAVLKNFSSINPSVMFKPGQTIRTISPQKTVMAAASVDETFDTPAAIYDLGRFLSTLSLFTNPDVDFQENKFVIKSGRSKVNYTYASESMIITPPDKDIALEGEVNIQLNWADLQNVIRAAGVLSLSEVAFIGDGNCISLAAVDSKNPTADKYDVVVAENVSTDPFEMLIKVENLKLMPADYEVTLSSKGLAHFKSSAVQYWIAVQSA